MTTDELRYYEKMHTPHLKPCYEALRRAIYIQACRDYVRLYVRGIVDGYEVKWPRPGKSIRLTSQFFSQHEAEALVDFIREHGNAKDISGAVDELIEKHGVSMMSLDDIDLAWAEKIALRLDK